MDYSNIKQELPLVLYLLKELTPYKNK